MQRREFNRLVYPDAARPYVMDSGTKVVSISEHGLSFICSGDCDEGSCVHEAGSGFEMAVEFHGGEKKLSCEYIRCFCDLKSKEKRVCAFIADGIARNLISSEQAYLLRNFPQFCRGIRQNCVAEMDRLSRN